MENHRENQEDYLDKDDFSFGNRGTEREMNQLEAEKVGDGKPKTMPPTSVMTRLILIMVWRKLIRDPNTYSSLIGLIWSLVSFKYVISIIIHIFALYNKFILFFYEFDWIWLVGLIFSCRWHIEMPAIIAKSISILSDAGLGMAMFSLGQYKQQSFQFLRQNLFTEKEGNEK